ncbi:MAG: hypothetical protein IBJ11_02710 [Phycisphaerales bacterium]|nr:hypothetical protein [Phycisphaerales bacterium]
MSLLQQLWLPTLLSAAAVWFTAFLSWAMLALHRKDFTRLPHEDAVRAALKQHGVGPGNYSFPYIASHQEARGPEAETRWAAGPVGTLTVFGRINMPRNMLLTFGVYLVVSALIAYLGSVTLPRGSTFGHVFQVLGTAGILSYCFAFLPNGIWFAHSPRALAMTVLDGLIAGLATGAIFAGMWPAA